MNIDKFNHFGTFKIEKMVCTLNGRIKNLIEPNFYRSSVFISMFFFFF